MCISYEYTQKKEKNKSLMATYRKIMFTNGQDIETMIQEGLDQLDFAIKKIYEDSVHSNEIEYARANGQISALTCAKTMFENILKLNKFKEKL